MNTNKNMESNNEMRIYKPGKKSTAILFPACVLSCFLLCGCGNGWQALPEDPIAFEIHEVENPLDASITASEDTGSEDSDFEDSVSENSGLAAGVSEDMDSDVEDLDDNYAAFDYNGRTYIPYGGMKNIVFPSLEYGECLGYLVDEESPEDDGMRVYPVKDDGNFMAVKLVYGVMEETMYWRAIDTRGKDIEIPRFIDPLGYDYWK